jgi:hypothetical protein
MKDDELRGYFEAIGKAIADQQILTIRMMAHQQAHLAAIRDFLVRQGEDRTMLNQRLRSSFEAACARYQSQLESYQQSGDAMKFVNSLVFPDETQAN